MRSTVYSRSGIRTARGTLAANPKPDSLETRFLMFDTRPIKRETSDDTDTSFLSRLTRIGFSLRVKQGFGSHGSRRLVRTGRRLVLLERLLRFGARLLDRDGLGPHPVLQSESEQTQHQFQSLIAEAHNRRDAP